MENFLKIGFAKISLAAQKSELPKFVSVKFVITAICTIIKCRQILNTPPHDKFESNMRRLKRFVLI